MGCGGSKHRKQCPHCRTPANRRSRSMHLPMSPRTRVVVLASHALGSIKLDHASRNIRPNAAAVLEDGGGDDDRGGAVDPKTPIRTPRGEPETIDAWELMKGLEDTTPLRPLNSRRSLSFDFLPRKSSVSAPVTPPSVSSFRELSPAKESSGDGGAGRRREVKKVAVYLTSLRGVRRTYEDCCEVRMILKGAGWGVEERDVSMHAAFKQELRERLGGGAYGLPQVFVGGRRVGGADEIRRMHEGGKLDKALEGCQRVGDEDWDGGACEICGDVRFVPCETCSGSCKVYDSGAGEGEGEEDSGGEGGGFRRCPDCNENGLRRCRVCCD